MTLFKFAQIYNIERFLLKNARKAKGEKSFGVSRPIFMPETDDKIARYTIKGLVVVGIELGPS